MVITFCEVIDIQKYAVFFGNIFVKRKIALRPREIHISFLFDGDD
jgi:hypothetical protein